MFADISTDIKGSFRTVLIIRDIKKGRRRNDGHENVIPKIIFPVIVISSGLFLNVWYGKYL